MEKIKQEYKQAFMDLLTNRVFIITVMLVTILSFGFTITNSSVGVDDTCLDRYYSGNSQYLDSNMLTSGRWGGYLIYQILNIKQFTPFWVEMLAVILIIIWAILWCVFLKKELRSFQISNSAYAILASVFISFPIINECFIYQNSILSVILSNILVSISGMLLYERLYHQHKKRGIIILSIILIVLGMAMYESCAQVYGLGICIMGGLICYREKLNAKLIIKYISISIIIMGIAVALNTAIVKGIHVSGIPESEAAEKEINWGNYSIVESIQQMVQYIYAATIGNIKYFPVKIFCVTIIMGLIMSVIQSYKRKNPFILLLFLGMVLSNFAIAILQLKGVLYRTCTSWSLFVAIIIMAFYSYMSNYKTTKIITGIWIAILVLQQSNYLTQMFYNDYIRYQRDLHIAYALIDDLETNYDITKPLVIMGTPKKAIGKDGSQVNSLSVLWWGKKAFDDNGEEFIKFLNSLGYEFNRPNDEQYEKGKIESVNMQQYPKEGSIKELEDCIIVNF